MYESKHQRMLTRAQFAVRVLRHTGVAAGAVGVSLFVGVLGYRSLGGLPWIDSVLNASMILGGMGPVDPLHTNAAKIFASVYALFSGLVFIGVLGMLLAPFVHRLMHRVHIDEE